MHKAFTTLFSASAWISECFFARSRWMPAVWNTIFSVIDGAEHQPSAQHSRFADEISKPDGESSEERNQFSLLTLAR